MSDDLQTYARMLDIAATTQHEGEADAAMRAAVRLQGRLGISAADLVEAYAQRFSLLDAAKQLRDERDALRLEVDRLQRAAHNGAATNGAAPNGFAQALWQNAKTTSSVTKGAAWMLQHDLVMRLSDKETKFLKI